MRIFSFLLSCFLCGASFADAQVITPSFLQNQAKDVIIKDKLHPLKELNRYVDALNIEGGIVWQRLKPNQKWVNICYILDRPFYDGLDLDEITKENPFHLKESSILEFNEPQVNYTTSTILHYYITHAQKVANKAPGEQTKIIIQVHRDSSGDKHVALIKKLLFKGFPDLEKVELDHNHLLINHLATYKYPEYNTIVDFRKGARKNSLRGFEDADIVISVSLAAGLSAQLKSGDLVVPKQFVPMNLSNNYIRLSQKYEAKNHLIEDMPDIIASQNANTLNKINRRFNSLNPLKSKHKARMLRHEDFKEITLLQVNKIFNPNSLEDPHFSVCCEE